MQAFWVCVIVKVTLRTKNSFNNKHNILGKECNVDQIASKVFELQHEGLPKVVITVIAVNYVMNYFFFYRVPDKSMPVLNCTPRVGM